MLNIFVFGWNVGFFGCSSFSCGSSGLSSNSGGREKSSSERGSSVFSSSKSGSENSVSLKLKKVYTDVSVDFPLLTSESFVSILIRNSKTGEWEDHTPTSPSDTITIDSSTEVLRIKLPEALNGKKCNLYLNENEKDRKIFNSYYDINLNQDEDVVFTEIGTDEQNSINQCTFTVEMDSLPLKKTYKIVKK